MTAPKRSRRPPDVKAFHFLLGHQLHRAPRISISASQFKQKQMAAHSNRLGLPAGSSVLIHRSRSTGHLQSTLHKPGRPALSAQATSTGRDASESKSASKSNEFPQFEDSSNDLGEFLPKREPGGFPNIAVRNRYFAPCNLFACPTMRLVLIVTSGGSSLAADEWPLTH